MTHPNNLVLMAAKAKLEDLRAEARTVSALRAVPISKPSWVSFVAPKQLMAHVSRLVIERKQRWSR